MRPRTVFALLAVGLVFAATKVIAEPDTSRQPTRCAAAACPQRMAPPASMPARR